MTTFNRHGVHIEQCANCRGIFLDRGELEQIVNSEQHHYGNAPAYESHYSDSPRPYQGHRDSPRPYQGHRDSPAPYGGGRYKDSPQPYGGHRRKRSFFEELFD
jgi:Zn-finger nucleic acid-binding protein